MRSTMYERVGGTPFFEELTRRFYAGVATDTVLAPLYPQDRDALEEARHHLCGFLVQYWGGPATYSEQRGHPRLRMRHDPFHIGTAERDAWLRHMLAAVDSLDDGALRPLDRTQMVTYFQASAAHMVNIDR